MWYCPHGHRYISIHALHEESDLAAALSRTYDVISIHALHEESDTDFLQMTNVLGDISIHALHEESDPYPRRW